MGIPTVVEKLEILRRIGERGLKWAQSTSAMSYDDKSTCIDLWQHLLDEVERANKYVQALKH